MKKKFPFRLLGLAIILLAGIACQSTAALFETGSIAITSPQATSPSHESVESAPIWVPVAVSSTFGTEKMATFYEDGLELRDSSTGNPFECALEPKSITPCAKVPIVKPGVHKIVADVTKLDGSIVSSEVTYIWAPYSNIDKTALQVAGAFGSTSPNTGYALVAGILIVGVTLAGLAIGKGSPAGAISGFLCSLILLAIGLYSADNTGAALSVVGAIVTIVVFALIIMLLRGTKGSSVHITDLETGRSISLNGLAMDGKPEVALKTLEAGRQVSNAIVAAAYERHGLPLPDPKAVLQLQDRNK